MAEKLFYIHGEATPELETFTLNILSILTGTNPSLRWRNEVTQLQYYERVKRVSEEIITQHIECRMRGHTMALLENDYPYNEIMPDGGYRELSGGSLEHYCIFSKDESLLTPEIINQIIEDNFNGKPTLVFMHEDEHTSIKQIKHAHIIVDWGGDEAILKQRYYDANDF